jgi:hypothetical protein
LEAKAHQPQKHSNNQQKQQRKNEKRNWKKMLWQTKGLQQEDARKDGIESHEEHGT